MSDNYGDFSQYNEDSIPEPEKVRNFILILFFDDEMNNYFFSPSNNLTLDVLI